MCGLWRAVGECTSLFSSENTLESSSHMTMDQKRTRAVLSQGWHSALDNWNGADIHGGRCGAQYTVLYRYLRNDVNEACYVDPQRNSSTADPPRTACLRRDVPFCCLAEVCTRSGFLFRIFFHACVCFPGQLHSISHMHSGRYAKSH